MIQRCLNAFRRGRSVKVGQPNRSAFLPRTSRQVRSRPQVNAHALLNEDFRAASRCGPRGTEFQALFVLVDDPFHGHVPALRYAQCLENAHAGDVGRCVFAHDLAHHQLQGQAMLALLLLRHLAHQATNRQRISRLLPLAKRQLELHDPPIVGVVAKQRSIDLFPIQGPQKQRCNFGPATRAEQIFEGHLAQLGDFSSEATLPCRIGIQKLARRAQRGNHLIRILEQIPVALLRFA